MKDDASNAVSAEPTRTKLLIVSTEGGVGKTMVAREASARLGAPLVSIERANADGQEQQVLRGSRIGHLVAYMPTCQRLVVDLGASEFTTAWAEIRKYAGCLEEFHAVVVPVKAEPRAQASALNTISQMVGEGVAPQKIFVVLNMVTPDQEDDLAGAFRPLYGFSEKVPFNVARVAIRDNEVHSRARAAGKSLEEIADDSTDYQALILAEPGSPNVPEWGLRVATRRLARQARAELDAVFNELLGGK